MPNETTSPKFTPRKIQKIETPEDTLRVIQTSLDDDKAEDITVIDLKGKSSLADYMVVATGRSTTHVRALSEHVVFQLKHGGFPPLSIAGLENNDWVAVDANDVLLHIFRAEVREFYKLEDMWKKDFTVGISQPEAPLDDQAGDTANDMDQEEPNQETRGSTAV